MSDFGRLFDKLEKIEARLDEMAFTLVEQEINLREHMRRSEMLEQKLEPVEKHVEQVKGVGTFLTYLGIVAGVAAAVWAIIEAIK